MRLFSKQGTSIKIVCRRVSTLLSNTIILLRRQAFSPKISLLEICFNLGDLKDNDQGLRKRTLINFVCNDFCHREPNAISSLLMGYRTDQAPEETARLVERFLTPQETSAKRLHEVIEPSVDDVTQEVKRPRLSLFAPASTPPSPVPAVELPEFKRELLLQIYLNILRLFPTAPAPAPSAKDDAMDIDSEAQTIFEVFRLIRSPTPRLPRRQCGKYSPNLIGRESSKRIASAYLRNCS